MEAAEAALSKSMVGDDIAILDELVRAYEELHLLHDLASILEEEFDHRMIFLKVVKLLQVLLPIEKAEVWIPSEEANEYRCLSRYEDGQVLTGVETTAFNSSLQKQLVNMGARVFREKHEAAGPLDLFLLKLATGLGLPAVVVPLLSKSRLIGVFLARTEASPESLDASTMRLMAVAAKHVSLGIHMTLLIEELRANEGLRREIEIARQIQHDLLPQSIPQSPRFDLYAGCVTAARVGGDYYDFVNLKDGRLGLLIADVAGHSVASGLIAMSFRSSFRFFNNQDLDLGAMFAKVNDTLYAELNNCGKFLSTFYGTLDEERRVFRYVNAGHNHPLVWRSGSGSFEQLTESGLLMGVLPGQHYSAAEVTLNPGDVLVLYTDGITEAENQRGEFFGVRRLEGAIRKNLSKGCREMYHYLLKEMYMFLDEHYNKDDVTLMILRLR